MLSFVVLDLCVIILFWKLWNIIFTTIDEKVSQAKILSCNWYVTQSYLSYGAGGLLMV